MFKHQLGDRYVRFDELPSAEQVSDLGLDLATEGSRRTLLGLADGCYQNLCNDRGLSPCWRINLPGRRFISRELRKRNRFRYLRVPPSASRSSALIRRLETTMTRTSRKSSISSLMCFTSSRTSGRSSSYRPASTTVTRFEAKVTRLLNSDEPSVAPSFRYALVTKRRRACQIEIKGMVIGDRDSVLIRAD